MVLDIKEYVFPTMEIDQWFEFELEKHNTCSKSLGVVDCNTHKQDIWAY